MMQRHFLWVLLLLNLMAGAWLAQHWVDDRFQPIAITWQAPEPVTPDWQPAEPAWPAAQAPDPVQFAALQDRPLFSPTRRPPPPPPPPRADISPPVDPLASVHLFGLFAGDGGEGGALLRVAGKVQSVVRGGKVGAWTVAAVTPTELHLESAAGRRVLTVQTVPGQRAPAPGADDAAAAAAAGTTPASGTGRTLSAAAQARANQLAERRRLAEERAAQRAAARAARSAATSAPEPTDTPN